MKPPSLQIPRLSLAELQHRDEQRDTADDGERRGGVGHDKRPIGLASPGDVISGKQNERRWLRTYRSWKITVTTSRTMQAFGPVLLLLLSIPAVAEDLRVATPLKSPTIEQAPN